MNDSIIRKENELGLHEITWMHFFKLGGENKKPDTKYAHV